MLYKFKSRASADLIMLEANARQLLTIMGKPPGAPGIITAAQLPAAMAALEAAVLQDEAQRRERAQDAPDAAHSDALAQRQPQEEPVHLRQRVAPFIGMLRRAAAAEADVVW